jgi:hypothetical protein
MIDSQASDLAENQRPNVCLIFPAGMASSVMSLLNMPQLQGGIPHEARGSLGRAAYDERLAGV